MSSHMLKTPRIHDFRLLSSNLSRWTLLRVNILAQDPACDSARHQSHEFGLYHLGLLVEADLPCIQCLRGSTVLVLGK